MFLSYPCLERCHVQKYLSRLLEMSVDRFLLEQDLVHAFIIIRAAGVWSLLSKSKRGVLEEPYTSLTEPVTAEKIRPTRLGSEG